ncbi:hypothetical protein Acsp02_09470 [Actinoplanes sp. NBRC 103695]|nr:hypothetical protein Acsp02_09470 [Actinoplanes sp. NBRC 103695]
MPATRGHIAPGIPGMPGIPGVTGSGYWPGTARLTPDTAETGSIETGPVEITEP